VSGRILVCALLAVSFAEPALAQSACSVPSFRRLPGQTVDGTMTVKAGRDCVIVMNASTGGVLDVRISQKPSVGKASVNGQRIVYSAKAGYAGADRFGYERDELDMAGTKRTSGVRIAVTVVP
jgi:hypothetical protein